MKYPYEGLEYVREVQSMPNRWYYLNDTAAELLLARLILHGATIHEKTKLGITIVKLPSAAVAMYRCPGTSAKYLSQWQICPDFLEEL